MMNFELIRSFIALAELCHFGEAAQRLNLSQPALSKHIKRLEDLLGAKLFNRDRQGTELTPFGQRFLDDVRPLLGLANTIWDNGLRAARGERGRLNLGFTFSSLDVMCRVLFRFRKIHPDIEVVFADQSSRHQIQQVKDGGLDAGFVRLPADEGLASIQVARDRLVLICPTSMALEVTDFDDPAVRALPFLALKPELAPGVDALIQRLFRSRDFQPRTLHHVNESMTLLRLVAAGFGVALMHESALRGVVNLINGVVVRPVGDPIATWDVGLVWRSDDRNPILKHFLHVAFETIGDPDGVSELG
ncbi:LysR family transcriptional regulator [Agrobacterium rhizogenes]|nr:LysR family transcriptional regulator [Rhizobium rhizogenes]NTG32209.1 LysR family transcriptional regulator [Rhizobium rhizogenes]